MYDVNSKIRIKYNYLEKLSLPFVLIQRLKLLFNKLVSLKKKNKEKKKNKHENIRKIPKILTFN